MCCILRNNYRNLLSPFHKRSWKSNNCVFDRVDTLKYVCMFKYVSKHSVIKLLEHIPSQTERSTIKLMNQVDHKNPLLELQLLYSKWDKWQSKWCVVDLLQLVVVPELCSRNVCGRSVTAVMCAQSKSFELISCIYYMKMRPAFSNSLLRNGGVSVLCVCCECVFVGVKVSNDLCRRAVYLSASFKCRHTCSLHMNNNTQRHTD